MTFQVSCISDSLMRYKCVQSRKCTFSFLTTFLNLFLFLPVFLILWPNRWFYRIHVAVVWPPLGGWGHSSAVGSSGPSLFGSLWGQPVVFIKDTFIVGLLSYKALVSHCRTCVDSVPRSATQLLSKDSRLLCTCLKETNKQRRKTRKWRTKKGHK